jgi:hypothetical protein
MEHLLGDVPLWRAGLFLALACILASELGRFVFRVLDRSPRGRDFPPDQFEGFLVGALFGLLAFVIGLTFSIAMERYELRRALVVDEANAISAAYFRADLFDEPDRTRLQTLLHSYTRLRVAPKGLWDADAAARMAQTRRLRDDLWKASRQAITPIRDTERASYFIDAVSGVVGVGTRRDFAGRSQIPRSLMEILIVYLLSSATVLGFAMAAAGHRRRLTATALLLLTAGLIVIILDLDRPQSGDIRVSQVPISELLIRLDNHLS